MKTKKSLRWAAAVVAQISVFSVLAFAQTPKLVYSNSLAHSQESGNAFKIQYGGAMGTGTLAGNLLTFRMTYPHGATVSSIVDNKGSTYSLGVSTDSGTSGWVTSLYYVPSAAAGIIQITVTFSAGVADWHGAVQEYSGVAASTPVDGTPCSSSTTIPATVQCSSPIVTAMSGDLIVASTMLVGGLGSTLCGNTSTSITPGGSFSLDTADPYCSDADEEFVQPSAGSITPSFTVAGNSNAFNIVAMAFKPAVAGTNPSGMYILHQQTVDINQGASSQMYYFVSSGNLLVASVDDGNTNSGGNIVTIDTCTPSNTFTKRSPTGFDAPQIFFVPSLAASTNMHCMVRSGQPGDTTLMVVYDIVGAAASPEDTNSPYFSGSGTTVNAPVLTPTVQPGIVIAVENSGTGPSTGVGTGAIYDNVPYTGETDSSRLNNGDGWQHFFYTSTAQIAFSWTQAIGYSGLQAFAITFKSGATEPPPPIVVITISPTSGSINVDATLQFTASVTGSTNTSVAWSTTCGTIDSSGLYTAPATASSCTVTATSLANGADSASASVTVKAGPPLSPPTIVITISPTSGSINVDATLQFTATVTGSANTSVAWTRTCGTINSSGLYTAPATASSCTVTATSLANGADSASASVTVTAGSPPPPPTIVITISPTSGSINVDATLQFTATVTGSTNTSVAWTRTCGTINSSGLYTAPATASFCTITATSLANAADSASARVRVTAIRRRH